MRTTLMFDNTCLKCCVTTLILMLQLSGGVAGAVDINTVPVGNMGNTGEWSGESYGGNGPDRICGAVDYNYRLGTYEVTAGQYVEFLNAVANNADTYGLYNADMNDEDAGCQITQIDNGGSYTYDFSGAPSGDESDWADRPVNYVSWGDAARFANWLHNGQPTTGVLDTTTTEDGAYYLNGANDNTALQAISREADWKWAITSEDEWYKAAYYKSTVSSYFDYATSSDTVPGYVNNAGNLSNHTGTAFTDGVTDPGNYATFDSDGGTDGVGSPYYRTEVGEWENSVSPYGTFDQAGNVWEWNEAIIYGPHRGLRGGSFRNVFDYDLHASNRNYSDPADEYYFVGFRVASQVPEPGSITFLLCGLLAGLMCWRRRR